MAVLRRNEIITLAHRKIGVASGLLTPQQLADGIQALNLIVNEESGRGLGPDKELWAEKWRALFLIGGQSTYGITELLAPEIETLNTAIFRDRDGDDRPIQVISSQEYLEIGDKAQTGDPRVAYLQERKLETDKRLIVWPTPASVATASEVAGTEGIRYRCTRRHVAAARNRPITGTDYGQFWDVAGSGGPLWVSGTSYAGTELILYSYKRPLTEFSAATDNPDMPARYGNYLTYRLAYELSPLYAITLEERKWLQDRFLTAREELFPGTRPNATSFHDKAMYF